MVCVSVDNTIKYMFMCYDENVKQADSKPVEFEKFFELAQKASCLVIAPPIISMVFKDSLCGNLSSNSIIRHYFGEISNRFK